jgi:PAS domain-containing protein
MKNRDKDKKQLQDELTELRKKITELEGIKTSQKQTEKKLTKPEEMYHLIAENTSDVITLTTFNLHPVYTYVSPSIKTNTGYEPEELIGKSPFDSKNCLLLRESNFVLKIKMEIGTLSKAQEIL